MSWISMLYKTYDNLDKANEKDLLPICHSTQKAHVEITINADGDFVRAEFIEDKKDENNISPSETVVPVTEKSASRSSGITAHALCDKLKFLASDYKEYTGEDNEQYFKAYIENLQKWQQSEYSTPKVDAIYKYISNGTIINDLINSEIFSVEPDGKLTDKWENAISKKIKLSTGNQTDAFIRFIVLDNSNFPNCWEDKKLQNAFIKYYLSSNSNKGLCYITGNECTISKSHPHGIRYSGDKAKIISSNDTVNYTYRGRFSDASDAVGVGFEVSQKAHNALKFLIKKQGKTVGSKVFLLWGTKNEDTPDLIEDSYDLLFGEEDFDEYKGVKKVYAEKFNSALSGYGCHLNFNNDTELAIICLDAATTGRMSINYYREYKGHEVEILIERIKLWHRTSAWFHRYNDKNFYGAPSPKDIAVCAFGTEQENFLKCKDKIESSVVERILPCITDGAKIPRDIVTAIIRKCCSPQNYKIKSNWEKILSISCSVYKKYLYDYKGEKIEMNTKTDNTLDFNCGRLLAVADAIENYALYEKYGKEGKRTTNAMRYFSSFSHNPCRTWKIIHAKLIPYMQQLGTKASYYKMLLEEISSLLDEIEFENARNLDGKMILGFYNQRKEINERIFSKNNKQEDK